MFLLGAFLTGAMKPANAKDIDFFPFPMINPKWGQDSIDAPIDGYMISKKPKNLDGAKKLVGFLGTATGDRRLPQDQLGQPRFQQAHEHGEVLAAAEEGGEADRATKNIAQYMDRDTRPDFASTVMIPSLQQFLNNPGDINKLVASIQKQKRRSSDVSSSVSARWRPTSQRA